jgi:hypothetical protein
MCNMSILVPLVYKGVPPIDIMVVGRYLPPRVNLTRIEYSGKQEETLMSCQITLEDLSAQEDNLY